MKFPRFPSAFDGSDVSIEVRQVQIKKLARRCNKASAASEARQRRSRRGNPVIPTAGLLHFVRNDGKSVMNYESINSRMAWSFISE
jgi:hypothetical protein